MIHRSRCGVPPISNVGAKHTKRQDNMPRGCASRFRLVVVCCFLFLCLFLQGCILAPAIDSFKQLGVTEEDRMGLLPKAIKGFHDALHWQNGGQAMQYVSEEGSGLRNYIRSFRRSKQRIVESSVDEVDYHDGAHEAEVVMMIKSYIVPYYVVEERYYEQRWVFDLQDGWKISEWREEAPTDTGGARVGDRNDRSPVGRS